MAIRAADAAAVKKHVNSYFRIMRSAPCAFLASLLFTGCGPLVNDEISEAFIRVNDSLEASRERSEQRIVALRAKLPPVPFADLGCPEFQRRADSLALALEFTAHAMAPLFSDLHGVAQDDTEAGERSFIKAGQGAELFAAITRAYDIASGVVPDDSTRMACMEKRSASFPFTTPEEWRAGVFARTPRAAVAAMLNKVWTDLEELRGMCDNALLKACINKS